MAYEVRSDPEVEIRRLCLDRLYIYVCIVMLIWQTLIANDSALIGFIEGSIFMRVSTASVSALVLETLSSKSWQRK